jgi:4-hydroxybenzoate polyprenyltransferase
VAIGAQAICRRSRAEAIGFSKVPLLLPVDVDQLELNLLMSRLCFVGSRVVRTTAWILDVTRANDWWQYKLPTLLGVAYLTAFAMGDTFAEYGPAFLKVILLLIPVASYVCVINDITDEAQDRAAGKRNRLAGVPVWLKLALLIGCLLTGIAVAWLVSDHRIVVGLYALNWLAFTLYSVAPFRLKVRGFWGILADASGGQLLPSLWTMAIVAGPTQPLPWPLVAAVGSWAFALGLRSILFHQMSDFEADQHSGVKTCAIQLGGKGVVRWTKWVLFPLEVACLFATLWRVGYAPAVVLLGIDLVLQWLLVRYLQFEIVLVAPKPRCRPALMKYYQLLFPLTFALALAGNSPAAWILIPLQLMLFPEAWRRGWQHLRSMRHVIITAG